MKQLLQILINLTLFVSIFQWDAPQFHATTGVYSYTTSSGNYTGDGNIVFGQETVELPYANEDEVFTIIFSHDNYPNNPQTVILTHEEVFGRGDIPLEIYFGRPEDTQKIFVSLITPTAGSTSGTFYIADLWDGPIDFDVTEIEIPVTADGESITITFNETEENIGYHPLTITISSSEIETYKTDNNPLVVTFTDF